MKIETSVSLIKGSLGQVANGRNAKTVLPVLSCVKISAENGIASVTTTNLEQTYRSEFCTNTAEDGAICVNAGTLIALINSLPEGKIELTADGSKLRIETKEVSSNLNGINADEFPATKPIAGGVKVTLPDLLKPFVAHVAKDDTRPALTGVLVSVHDGRLMLCATDAYRLARGVFRSVDGEFSVIIPSRFLAEVGKYDQAEAIISKDGMFVQSGNMTMQTMAISGNYPDFAPIIPNSYKGMVTCEKSALANAIKTIRVIGDGVCKFSFNNGKMSVSGSQTELGDVRSEFDCVIEGQTTDFSCKASYLQDVLSNVEANTVTMSLGEAHSPIALQVEGVLYLIMPMAKPR